jgi:hypothetical protein
MNNEYWASSPRDSIASAIRVRRENYYNFLRQSQFYILWQQAYDANYKASVHGGGINQVGENGEYSVVYVNHYRNICQNLLNLTVSQRPSWQARATNTDYKSLTQAKLANGLLDYYMREKRLERYIRKTVESAVSICGEAFIHVKWDANGGDEYGVNEETGAVIRNGDLSYSVLTSPNVARDPALKSFDDRDWLEIRTYVNKYEIAAQYPEMADQITALTYDFDNQINDIQDFDYNNIYLSNTDLIPMYEFYHKDNSALPGGRYVCSLHNDLVLIDSPLPYREIPIYRLASGDIEGMPFGYTVGFDLLPIQKAINNLYSTIQTNQEVFGVQNILMPQGSNIGLEEIGGGLNILEYVPALGKPEAFNPIATPGEIFNHVQKLEQLMETLSGINSVIRGQPEASLKSGAALALIASQAYQTSLLLQASFIQLLEDVGTATINILKDFASVPRVAMIAGLSNRSYMREFTGDDLSEVNRVLVDVGNPLANSVPGRLELASNYMQIPPEFRDQYAQIISTGRLEPVIEGETAELLLIKAENEKLQRGEAVQALITDDPMIHIREHKVVLASPEAREREDIVQATLDHIQQHIDLMKNGDPDVLAVISGQPLPPANPPPPPQMMNNQNPVPSMAQDVNMPSMPNVAGSNEPFVPPIGAMPPGVGA